MRALYRSLQTRYAAFNQREQRFINAAALALLLGLVWWVALEPALQGRARLIQQLPLLRLQTSELAGLAAQGNIRSTQANTDLGASLSTSLNTADLESNSIDVLEQERVRVRLSGADYSRLVFWLVETQAAGAVRLETATMSLQEPGRVYAELVFQRNR